MTTETMNIHQALVKLKTLDKRIESAIKKSWMHGFACEYVVAGCSTRQGGSKMTIYN